MKLYNRTKCPDRIIKPLLIAAGKSVGARTTNVVVRVTQGSAGYSRGVAYPTDEVRKCTLQKKGRTKSLEKWLFIKTDKGYIEIVLPGPGRYLAATGGEYRSMAKAFYETAQHEWAHVKDYQQETYVPAQHQPSGKRIAWTQRTCEQYAMEQVEQAKDSIQKNKCLLQNLTDYYILKGKILK